MGVVPTVCNSDIGINNACVALLAPEVAIHAEHEFGVGSVPQKIDGVPLDLGHIKAKFHISQFGEWDGDDDEVGFDGVFHSVESKGVVG